MLHTTRPQISYIDNTQMYLDCLFSGRDIADGEIQIESPEIWNRGLLVCATAIHNGAVQYARDTLKDRESLAQLQAIDLPAKWAQGKLDIRSDLNWLYAVLCGDEIPGETFDNKDKINFLFKLCERGGSVKIRTFGIPERSYIPDNGIKEELEQGLHDALNELIQAGKKDVDGILASGKKEG